MSLSVSYFRHLTLLALFFVSQTGIGQQLSLFPLDPEKIAYARDTERKAIAQKDSLMLAEAYYLFGKAYAFSGDVLISQQYFIKSFRILEPRGDSFELGRIYTRLGENEGRQGHVKEGLRFVKLSLPIFQRLNSEPGLIRAYGYLGQAYAGMLGESSSPSERKMRLDSVLFCYTKIEALAFKLKDTLAIAETHVKLGTLYIGRDNQQAISRLQSAFDIFFKKGKYENAVVSLVHMASAYKNSHQQEMEYQTIMQAQKLYASKNLQDYFTKIQLESAFVEYYAATEKWKSAFTRLGQLTSMQQTQYAADRDGAITRINKEYENEKKEVILEAQKKELGLNALNMRTQKRLFMTTFALFLTTTVMCFVFFKLYRKNQRTSLRNEELIKEQNHRVKNNLQVISSLLNLQSKKLSDEEAKKAVNESRLRVQSMALVNQRLYDGDNLAEVNLSEFVSELVAGVLKAYGHSNIRTVLTVEPIYLNADKAIPLGLILNELITNACKYAFPDNKNPELIITCIRKGKSIELVLTDNGPGFMPDTANISSKKGSFGLNLILMQVDQLYASYHFKKVEDPFASGMIFSMKFRSS